MHKFSLRLSQNPKMRIFNYKKYKESRDILSIAFGIFRLEKELKKRDINTFFIERFIENYKHHLDEMLSELISYILLRDVKIKFFHSKKKLIDRKFVYYRPSKAKVSVLFSGGIDSFSGIFWAKKYFNDNLRGVFCAHSDQAWNIHIVNSLSRKFLSPSHIDLETIYVPPLTSGGYSQLRGFLYFLSAGALMKIMDSDTLVISECGTTMYQPRFGAYDTVTMTTHPVVLEISSNIMSMLLDKKIKIIVPFENMTKSEIIAYSTEKEGIKETFSCIRSRFKEHCGTCYGCCIRMLGAITAGVEDVEYNRNPIIEEKANKENLLSLLSFSLDILLNYENMPLYSIENIESYKKLDLFIRFALDNFSAIYILKNRRLPISKEVENFYKEFVNKIGEKQLKKRIEEVRSKKFKINTSHINR